MAVLKRSEDDNSPQVRPASPSEGPDALPAADGEAIDLLALVDVARDSAVGKWRRVEDGVVAPKQSSVRLRIPCIPPQEYALDIVLSCPEAPLEGLIGFVVSGHQVSLLLEGFSIGQSSTSGLESIDGRRVPDNETAKRGRWSRAGEKYHVRCEVREDVVRVNVNGQLLTEYKGRLDRFTGAPTARVGDPRIMYLGANFRAVTFHSIVLTPIKGNAKLLVAAE